MQFGDKFVAAVVGACAVGVGIGVLLVNSFGKVEPSSRAFDQPPPAVEPDAAAKPPEAPETPALGLHSVEQVLAPDVVSLDGLGPVRLLGVDPRTGPGNKPVDPALGKALLEQVASGKQVLVSCDPATADTGFKDENGAYLVYLMLDDGTLVNTELIARGAAVADLNRPCARRDEFVRAERDARWNGRGLWEVAAARPLAPVPPSGAMPDPRRAPLAPGATPPAAPGKNDVLVTRDGRFHRPSCSLSKGGVVMSIDDARGKHYLACPVCFSSPRVKV
jgi:endonuclease YncB( thermonuclease family)